MKCPRCENVNPDTRTSCWFCGTPIDSRTINQAANPETTESKNFLSLPKTIGKISITLISALAIAYFIFLVYSPLKYVTPIPYASQSTPHRNDVSATTQADAENNQEKTNQQAKAEQQRLEKEVTDTVRNYYEALNRHDMVEAIGKWQIPPNDLISSIQKSEYLTVKTVRLKTMGEKRATVRVDFLEKAYDTTTPSHWQGNIDLTLIGANTWNIIDMHLTQLER